MFTRDYILTPFNPAAAPRRFARPRHIELKAGNLDEPGVAERGLRGEKKYPTLVVNRRPRLF